MTMATSLPRGLHEDIFDYQTQLLAELKLTIGWYYAEGDIAVDEAFVGPLWDTLTPTDVTKALTVAHHISALGLIRDLWSNGDIPPPYGVDYHATLPDTQTMWSELHLTTYSVPSNERLFDGLLDLLGRALPRLAYDELNFGSARVVDGGNMYPVTVIPVGQIWTAVQETGFKGLHHPSSGLIINGEDSNSGNGYVSPLTSGFAFRFAHPSVERTVKTISFIAGYHATNHAPHPLAGVCGMLRSLNAQLVYHFRGKINLSFLSDQYLCKLYHGGFMALLYLFKHLIFAIGWAGAHANREYVTVVIDSIDHFEKPEHIEQWSNFVRVLRELTLRCREIPDACSAYLARGINFKYVLVHPNVSLLEAADKYELVIRRSDVPEQEVVATERRNGSSVWVGGIRYGSIAEARAAAESGDGAASGSGSGHEHWDGDQNGTWSNGVDNHR